MRDAIAGAPAGQVRLSRTTTTLLIGINQYWGSTKTLTTANAKGCDCGLQVTCAYIEICQGIGAEQRAQAHTGLLAHPDYGLSGSVVKRTASSE